MTLRETVEPRELLGKLSIFEGIQPEELDELLQLTTTKRLRAREVLFRKGDKGAQLFGVMRGRLRVSGVRVDGKEVVFSYLDPGEAFGEIALLDSDPRSATVEAIEPTELLTLHRRELLPFLNRNPRLGVNLASVLAGRVRRLSELVEDTLFLRLPSRLAKKLLSLAETYGKATEGGIRIELRLPQQELGELVGTSRESINKQLRAWVDQGWLEVDRGYITLRGITELESLARVVVL